MLNWLLAAGRQMKSKMCQKVVNLRSLNSQKWQVDRVICYYCGEGLYIWLEDDDPWEQHALLYGHCMYVQVIKGEHFIEEVKKKLVPSDPSDLLKLTACGRCGDSLQTEDGNKSVEGNKLCDTRLCLICCDAEFNTVFLPCGHVNSCAKCALSLRKCPVCQCNVKQIKRIYLP